MTEEEYERKLEIVGNIMSKDEDALTPDEEAELLQLVDEIEAYEDGLRGEWVI